MSDINVTVLSGRLTRNAELRYTPNGTAVTDISLASNRIWNRDGERQEDTVFVDVTVWGKQAEVLTPMLTKGTHVMVDGRLKLDRWETPDGSPRSKLSLVANSVNLTPRISKPTASKENVTEDEGEEVPF